MRSIFEFIVGSSLFIEKIGAKAQRHRGTVDRGPRPVGTFAGASAEDRSQKDRMLAIKSAQILGGETHAM